MKLYSECLPAPHRPLPFLYLSTGIETRFAKSESNGWTFWKYERSPGDWVRLKVLRRR